MFAWEQCKLGDVYGHLYSGNTPSRKKSANFGGDTPWIRTADLNNGLIKSATEFLTYEGIKQLKILPENTIVLAMYGGFNQIGRTGILGFPATINQALVALTPHKNINQFFAQSYLNRHIIDWRRVAASSRKDPNITKEDVEKSEFSFGSLEEQNRISKLISRLDHTITLHEEKEHQLERLKSALLQKMFADKSGYPPVRFEGFSNEWGHCKLRDVADITTGSRNHQDSVTDGKYPFFVRSDKVERLNEYDFDTKAILVPGDGRIGEIFHYYNGKFALHQRVYKVDNFNGINELFLLGLFKYSFKEHALRLNAQGTVPSLRLPMFTNWSISVPMITEQERIGVFFQKLERTISLYDHKLELLKKVKRSMLQAMFI
ncbi:restriction endonuclease subunit S [Lactobacillus delbrueckii]|uniref:restriction endonuclease subunit S n=1 Tax=Lactobacillus delbrueckii TaxID=1584 RepID=UPI002F355388